jgi:mRNA-degrading endonuclease toxin of MazEF toxin-antitoxin module
VSPPRKRTTARPKLPAAPLPLRRGDVLWINCDPSIGVEPRKVCTCVVVSMDIANDFGAAVTVIPTQAYGADRAARAYAVDLRKPRSTIDEPRVANASMIMTYDKARVVARAGRVHADAMKAIDAALALHLGLAQP